MMGWRGRLVVPVMAAVSLVALKCAKPPTAEKKAADEAAYAAKQAGAETYTRSELVAMTAALRKAEAEMTAKAYRGIANISAVTVTASGTPGADATAP